MSTLTCVPLCSSSTQPPILLEPPEAVFSSPAALEFALLEVWLASSPALQLPLHQIESQQQTKGREVRRLLLQAHLQQRGPGDVRPALRVPQPSGDLLYTHRRLSTRSLKTIFGTVKIVRMGYSRPGLPSLYPLDQTPRLARSLLLLRTTTAFGEGGGAKSFSGISRSHRRLYRCFCLQAKPGGDVAGCGPGF